MPSTFFLKLERKRSMVLHPLALLLPQFVCAIRQTDDGRMRDGVFHITRPVFQRMKHRFQCGVGLDLLGYPGICRVITVHSDLVLGLVGEVERDSRVRVRTRDFPKDFTDQFRWRDPNWIQLQRFTLLASVFDVVGGVWAVFWEGRGDWSLRRLGR